MLKKLKEATGTQKYIDLCFVPGNHDVDYTGGESRREYYENALISDPNALVQEECDKLNNYFNLAAFEHCFSPKHRLFYRMIISEQGNDSSETIKLEINLLNVP